jgi:hypothetical protein
MRNRSLSARGDKSLWRSGAPAEECPRSRLFRTSSVVNVESADQSYIRSAPERSRRSPVASLALLIVILRWSFRTSEA